MDKKISHEAMEQWQQKSELEKTVAGGIHGTPELKRAEKSVYLGEFRERIISMLTKQQVAETAIYPEIVKALQDKRAARMIISGDINRSLTDKYQTLAIRMKKPYMLKHDTRFRGETGLIVVSDQAVDIEDIEVVDRKTRLQRLGLPESLINAARRKVCGKCYAAIMAADADEAINYRKLTFWDRLAGEKCSAH